MAEAPSVGGRRTSNSCVPTALEEVTDIINIAHSDEFPRCGLLNLLDSGKNADVTFIVEGKQLRAHRVIVASQSTYFDSLLYGSMRESQCSEITLEDTQCSAFKLLLKYMYTGSVKSTDIQNVLELLVLADRYGFLSLHSSIENGLCAAITPSNILQVFFYADVCNTKKLHKICTTFLELNAEIIIDSQSMMDLPREHLRSLLSMDYFLVDEVKIFEAVKKWKEYNGLEVDEITDVLKCVRLSEISRDKIESIVWPSSLYPESVIKDMLLRHGQGFHRSNPRGRFVSNLFNSPCNMDSSNFWTSAHPGHVRHHTLAPNSVGCIPNLLDFTLSTNASQKVSAITFRFGDLCLINHLKFEGSPSPFTSDSEDDGSTELKRPYSYKLQVSIDQSCQWDTVIDHSICKCYLTQDLYFPSIVVRCIRLEITKSHKNLQIRFLCCDRQKDTDALFRFYEGGSIAPTQAMTPTSMMHWFTEKGRHKTCVFTFHQPYHISKIRFRIKGLEVNSNHTGQVLVKVALYNRARYYMQVALLHCNFSERMVAVFHERLVSIVTVSILSYFDGRTGEDLLHLVHARDLKIENFMVIHQN